MENNSEYPLYQNPQEENERPGFLTFLCVLTFIGSGFSLLSNLIMPMFAPLLLEMVQGSSAASMPGVLDTYEQMATIPVWQFYLLALFCATSILGAIYLFKMKKIGFHIYTISQLTQLFIGLFIIGGTFKPTPFSIFITALFIGLYAIYYKKYTSLELDEAEQLENNN